ncbi:MAG: restriction endonuclease subunit S [Prolixibacteraceae bacterium]|nr:restriction endonuclease subunit S [Prolixibacteraceae bacterium]
MELRAGYKITDIGILPIDWELKKLSELTSLITNGFVGTVKSQYTESDDGVTYIQGYNVEENSFNYRGIKKVTSEFHKLHLKSCLQEGDLLTIQTGDVGLTTIVPKELVGANCHALIISRFKKEKSNPKYFSLYLNSNEGRARLKEIEIGTTMKHINVGDMIHFLVPVPTKAEQTAIATALSDTDALISSLEKLIAKKRNIKQGAIQKLLQPKVGWEVKELGEIGECIIGLTYKPENIKESGTLVLRSSNVQGNTLKYEDNVYVNSEIPKKLINKENDILICVRNGSRDLIGKCALLTGRAIGETFGAFMSVFRSPFNEFVFILFQSEIIKKQIDEHLGATINQITNKSLNSFEIPFPPIEEQTRIATILSDMDAEINALETKLEKYKMLKLGMMQNLLTGKIRLV